MDDNTPPRVQARCRGACYVAHPDDLAVFASWHRRKVLEEAAAELHEIAIATLVRGEDANAKTWSAAEQVVRTFVEK